MPTLETIRLAPKALLHDHLDGGLRPATIVDLAREYGYADLPTTDADELEAWMRRGADRKSLELYLETFAHTIGVLQERDAIIRVAAECAEDLAADGIVYAEVRYAPELSVERGLTLDEVVEANLEGFRIGAERAAAAGRPIVMKVLVTAMRQFARSLEVAECAVRWRDAGVVGFDIAGPEAGYRPTRYLEAFDYVRRENFHITIHAGESFGPPSIWEALQFCGAERLGHGVRIVDDITLRPDGSVELGRLAAFVRDRRVPLEMCPTSNVHTGAVQSVADHPIDLLRRLRYRLTVNTDNRLMSGVSLSSEFAALDEAFGIGLGEMEWLTINAMKSAFAPFDERLRIINEVVKPRYAQICARARHRSCPPRRPEGQSVWNTSRRVFHHVPGLTVGEGILHGVGELPPALRLRVGRHRCHVGLEVLPDVVEGREQVGPVAPDRVVPDVRPPDLVEHPGPRIGVQALVLLDRLGTYPDPLPEAPDAHRLAPAVAEATPAALISSATPRHSSPSGKR